MSEVDQTNYQGQIELLAFALRMEGEGQYNLAKLARATADSLARRAAYQFFQQTGRADLAGAAERIASLCSSLGLETQTVNAFQRGAEALSANRLPLIREVPHPYVCRTCGHIVLGEPAEKCLQCGAWPDTFQWFAPVYWLEAFDPHPAMAMLRRTPLDVAALLDGLSEQTLTRQPEDGGWSICNTITHLRDAQGLLEYRLELFAKQENPLLESKAVWSWATEEHIPTTMEIFAEYEATRVKILSSLEALPLQDWQRTGSHQEFGTVSIKQQVSYFAAHERTHLPQIERLCRI